VSSSRRPRRPSPGVGAGGRGPAAADTPAAGAAVHVCAVKVRIADVVRDRAALTAACFTPDELAEIPAGRPQTLAGSLAVKRALVQLAAALGEPVQVAEKDFVLSHDRRGAPRLVSAPAPVGPAVPARLADVRISISHTREWAYGLAVYQGHGHG